MMKFGKKVCNITKKESRSNHVYNEKYIKAKIKCYNGKINTTFHNNRIPKEDSEYIKIKTIILKCFYRNVNMSLKEKGSL